MYNGSTVYLDEDTYKLWVRTNPSDPWSVVFDMWSPSAIKFGILLILLMLQNLMLPLALDHTLTLLFLR